MIFTQHIVKQEQFVPEQGAPLCNSLTPIVFSSYVLWKKLLSKLDELDVLSQRNDIHAFGSTEANSARPSLKIDTFSDEVTRGMCRHHKNPLCPANA